MSYVRKLTLLVIHVGRPVDSISVRELYGVAVVTLFLMQKFPSV